jgi:5'-deoxynucleotidase YfbR-like HD superfamily hydrolase
MRMSNMKRFNTAIRVHQESVAEHSFYVAMYTARLIEIFLSDVKGVDNVADVQYFKYITTMKALTHDVHEIVLSDIPHNVKKTYPLIDQASNEVEKDFNDEFFRPIYTNDFNEKEDIISNLIVELADVLAVIEYSQFELSLGNKSFDDILESAITRFEETAGKLNSYTEGLLRHNYSTLIK